MRNKCEFIGETTQMVAIMNGKQSVTKMAHTCRNKTICGLMGNESALFKHLWVPIIFISLECTEIYSYHKSYHVYQVFWEHNKIAYF